mgnify:CR=1 FL=1
MVKGLPHIESLLSTVCDPEIPVLSIYELGILKTINYTREALEVVITPTYNACPAMKVFEMDIVAILVENGYENVSVRIDNEFMKAVKEDALYTQQYPVDVANPEITREVKARDLWGKMIHNAWKSAEPGILFWDTIINESVPDCYADLGYKTVSTNPCGEIPLCPYDSCRLLAINLFSYVENPFTDKAKFNFKLFKKHIVIAQRMMDDIIDLELEKIDGILAKIDADPEQDDVKATEKNL